MNEAKSNDEKSITKRGLGIFRRDKPVLEEINEFIIGDLDSTTELIIGANGAVAGNISAPSVRIKGTVFGSVTAPEIIVDQTGQVWGDLFASALMITVNAKVHGWVSTFEVGTLELIQGEGLSAAEVMSISLADHSEELKELRKTAGLEGKLGNIGSQPEVYRNFQVEEGAAIVARLEMEKIIQDSRIENMEQLKAERDLFKDRFRKLALWVYQNQKSALE